MTPPITRKELLTARLNQDTSVSQVRVQEVTMGPGVKAPLHLHPCPTMGLVTEGTISFQIEGQPVSYLTAGEAFYEPENVRIARFDNDTDMPAKFVVFYLLGKDAHETICILKEYK